MTFLDWLPSLSLSRTVDMFHHLPALIYIYARFCALLRYSTLRFPILGFHTLDFGSTSETTTTKRKTVTARAGHYCTNPSDFAFATAIDFLDFSVSIIPLSGPYGTFLLGLEHLYLLASSSLHRTAVHNRFLVLSHSPPGSSSLLLFFSLILDLFSWSQLPYTGLGG